MRSNFHSIGDGFCGDGRDYRAEARIARDPSRKYCLQIVCRQGHGASGPFAQAAPLSTHTRSRKTALELGEVMMKCQLERAAFGAGEGHISGDA